MRAEVPECHCVDGYYEDPTTLECLKCGWKCLTCSGSPLNCTDCKENRIDAEKPECPCPMN